MEQNMTTKTSRRAVLAGGAALPALSVAAVATEPDPIFEAIARFKAIEAVWNETGECEPASESPDHPAWLAKSNRECDEWNARREAMLRTVPTTREGALALIAAVTWNDAAVGIDDHEVPVLIETLAQAVPA
jgi:hypothetical protein